MLSTQNDTITIHGMISFRVFRREKKNVFRTEVNGIKGKWCIEQTVSISSLQFLANDCFDFSGKLYTSTTIVWFIVKNFKQREQRTTHIYYKNNKSSSISFHQ